MSSVVPEQTPSRRPRRAWIAAAVAALVVALLIFLVLYQRSSPTATPAPGETASASDAPATSPAGSSSPSGSASRTPAPQPSDSTSKAASPTAPPSGPATVVPTQATKTTTVPLDKKGTLGGGVVASVSKVESVKGVAKGPGEVAGPAVRVTVSVHNGSSKPISMNLALVNLYYGKDKTPASPLSGPKVSPLSAPIAPGKTDSGRYVFSVPSNERDLLSVEFSYTTEAPTVIFKGTP